MCNYSKYTLEVFMRKFLAALAIITSLAISVPADARDDHRGGGHKGHGHGHGNYHGKHNHHAKNYYNRPGVHYSYHRPYRPYNAYPVYYQPRPVVYESYYYPAPVTYYSRPYYNSYYSGSSYYRPHPNTTVSFNF